MRKIVSLLFLAFLWQQVMAIPAYPVRKTVTTADGKTITVTLRGDEHFSYFTDDYGKKFVLMPSGRVQEMTVYDEAAMEATQQAKSKNANTRRQHAIQKAGLYEGDRKGLVILANFTDVKFSVGSNEIYNDYFNKENYKEYGNKGSVHEYFSDQSYGRFNLTFDVVGPIQLPQPMAYYGEHEGKTNDKNAKQFAVDAITAAAPLVGDFSKYDWDGDGYVDQVFIIFAGYNEAQGGPAESIWPHEWSIMEYKLEFNGMKFGTYGCASELRGNKGNNLDGIGTACHEFSHCLGLPDSYDTSSNGCFGMGDWDLMSSGSYLAESGAPMGYTSYQRWVSGWLEPKEINGETVVTDMKALEDTPEAYVLYNDANHNEFYMLENRQNPKWGASIHAHGLMVMHVDYDETAWWYNQVNTDQQRQHLTFIPADNMLSGSNYDGDPYPGTRNKHALTDETTPAATVYNVNTDGTHLMGKSIENIQESQDGLISFLAMKDFVAGPKNLASEWISDNAFKLNWEEVPGAQGYEVDMVYHAAPKTDPYEAVMLEEDFAKTCYAEKVSTLNNIAGKLDTYTKSKGWTGTNLFRGPKGLQMGQTDAKKGTLKSPDVAVSYYGKTTARIVASPVTAGESVKVNINLYIDGSAWGNWTLTFTGEEDIILNGAPTASSTVAYEIVPEKKLNMSYFSVHDGDFRADDFNKKESLPNSGVAPKCAMLSVSGPSYVDGNSPMVSNTNSFVYDNVEPGALYLCKVRAIMGDSKYSRWSSQIEVKSTPTAIEAVEAEKPATSATYDLMGRRVADDYKGIVIRNGKKHIQ